MDNTNDNKVDSLPKREPVFSKFEEVYRNNKYNILTDSTLLFHHQYNKKIKENNFIQDLGDVATPFIQLIYTPNFLIQFNPGYRFNNPLFFKPENAIFGHTKNPFTYFYYAQGRVSQNGFFTHLDALHTHNFGKNNNLTVNFHSTTNNGFFPNMTTALKNLQISDHHISKNKRYNLHFLYTYNKLTQADNGGILRTENSDSTFRELPPNFKPAISMELTKTLSIRKQQYLSLSQVYWLIRTNNNDNFNNKFGLRHHVIFDKNSLNFRDGKEDIKSNIYNSVYQFYESTNDSFSYFNLKNKFEIFTPSLLLPFGFVGGIEHEAYNFMQKVDKQNFHRIKDFNLKLYGQFDFIYKNWINIKAKTEYVFIGFNQNDFKISGNASGTLSQKNLLYLKSEIEQVLYQPNYQNLNSFNNHYKWQNNFNQINHSKLAFSIEKHNKRDQQSAFSYGLPLVNFKAGFQLNRMNNWVYFDENSQAIQNSGQGIVNSIFVQKHFNLKRFQFNQLFVFQQFNNVSNVFIQLPNWLNKSTLYYQDYWFKKALFIQIGAEINMVSGYKASSYNPALQEFQVSQQTVGNYPFVDLFINAEIQVVRVFLKMEHVNQDLLYSAYTFPNYYYSTPFYSSNTRRFRLGLTWKFFY